ncbi:MAG: lysophospholipid acyltransferase family protein [Pseudobdellovibrionaceae bacterium]
MTKGKVTGFKTILLFPFYLLGFFVYFNVLFFLRVASLCLGIIFFDILRFRRQVVLDNMKIVYPKKDLDFLVPLARSSIIRFCEIFLEFFKIPFLGDRWIEQNVVFEGVENLVQAQAQKKGILMLSLHLGSGDLACSVITRKLIPITIITKFFRSNWLNEIWFSIRGRQGVQFIEPHGAKTPFDILKSLKAQRGVVFVIDQFMGRPYAVVTKFFGVETGTAYGLALFYLKTKAPVLPVYCYKGPAGKLHIVFEKVLELDGLITENKETNLVVLTQEFNHCLERIILKQPTEWMWIHRRWKEYE